MALTATYDATLARVRLSGTGLPANTDHATIRRYDNAALTNPVGVRGGAITGLTSASTITLDDYEFTDAVANRYEALIYDAAGTLLATWTVTITPTLNGVWLKNVARPYLNRLVEVFNYEDVTTPTRSGVFDIVARRLPVAVTELRGSRRVNIVLLARTTAAVRELEDILSFGDPVFLHTPATSLVPGPMHAVIGDVTESLGGRHQEQRRYLTLPLTEVGAPDPVIVGATITWAGVTAAYATWSALIAARPTWLALLESISAPTDEMVG